MNCVVRLNKAVFEKMTKIEKALFPQGAEMLVGQQTSRKQYNLPVSLFLTPTSSFFIPQQGIDPLLPVTGLIIFFILFL